MTILAVFLLLLVGIFLIFDGAFAKGLFATLFATILPNAAMAAVSVVRIIEVVAGGAILAIVGLVFSTCLYHPS